jgi:NAD(P)-dependent dehydrogenase (short-subunit alcohol dehydrogenase family)
MSSNKPSYNTGRVGGVVSYGVYFAAILSAVLGFYNSSLVSKLGLHRLLVSTLDATLVGITPSYRIDKQATATTAATATSTAAALSNDQYTLKGIDLTGQTAIVTGASSPVGLAISETLARLGAGVFMGCVDEIKCEELAVQIRNNPNTTGVVTTMHLDTNFVGSVKWFAQNFRRQHHFPSTLDMLFLNEDVVYDDPLLHQHERYNSICVPVNDQNVQTTFATNHLGHHMLYRWMMPYLNHSKFARVVVTSSPAMYNSYTKTDFDIATSLQQLNNVCTRHKLQSTDVALSYGHAKLAQLAWLKYLTRKAGPSSTIVYNAFYPGRVQGVDYPHVLAAGGSSALSRLATQLLSKLERREARWSAYDAAVTGLVLGTMDSKGIISSSGSDSSSSSNVPRGKYFHPLLQLVEPTNPIADNEELQEKLWAFSEELLKDGFLPFENWSQANDEDEDEE